ncbi:ATP-grasp domain-containing protein [Buttiauxella sp. A2-C2_NF]|uniref:ATP-grasp domain-containing protein n=1 Tax=Buttiauxella ferragutiae TaxID=82989 RepID=UPI001E5FCFAF|nr:ATP-grasp domain-containing protein [Buttiauxella ferragutiae]MCE0828837.1 ATP-grasp domain-containing protein [Buttiauxella ferragutiae]
MKKQTVLILAKTEHARTPYDEWLQDSGVIPVVITSPNFFEGYSCHITHCYSLSNYDQDDDGLFELVEKIYQITPFDYVFCRAEVDVIRAADIRSRYGISGQSSYSAFCYRDKYLMKERLSGEDVQLSAYRKVDSPEDIREFCGDNGFPYVIKPRLASGSSGVAIIKSLEELDSYLKYSENQVSGMLVENYVDGEMFHVDGLIVDGELRFIQPFKYVNDCLSYRDNMYIGNIPLGKNERLYSLLADTTKKIICCMPETKNFAFHCELWVTKQQDIIFCEIASRTGGGMISFLIEEMSGLNIDRAWLLAECQVNTVVYPEYHEDFQRFGCVCIPPANGKLLSLPSVYPSGVRRTHLTGKSGETYGGGEKSGLYLIGHVVEADDPASVQTIFSACYENIHNRYHWESVGND